MHLKNHCINAVRSGRQNSIVPDFLYGMGGMGMRPYQTNVA